MVTPDQPQIRNVLATPAGRTDGQWVCQRSASTIARAASAAGSGSSLQQHHCHFSTFKKEQPIR